MAYPSKISIFLWGAMASLAMPPLYLLPLLAISLCKLYKWLQIGTKPFATGWWWGFGYFTTSLYWFAYPLSLFDGRFIWLIPIAVTLLPAILAIYIALFAVIFTKTTKYFIHPHNKIFMFAFIWVIFEILRSNLFTGFAWNLLGYSLNFWEYLMQPAYIFGIYGQSFFTVIICLTPILYMSGKYNKNSVISYFVVMILIIISYSYLHINQPREIDKQITIRVVQPNIAQEKKWDRSLILANFRKQIAIATINEGEELPDITIFPEVATPLYYLQKQSNIRQILSQSVLNSGQILIGGERLEYYQDGMKFYNSLFNISAKTSDIENYYDKQKLVPFGEFIPFKNYIPYIDVIAPGKNVSFGSGDKILDVKGITVKPLICYEGIFAEYLEGEKTDLLISITNDAWFGVSTQPYQHFEMTRLRAIEQDTPLARSANTGISAIIDNYGNILTQTKINEDAVISATINLSKPSKGWFNYAYMGNWGLLFLILFILYFRISLRNS